MDQRTSNKWPNNGIVGANSDAAISFATHLFEHTSEIVAAVDADLRLIGLNAAFHREFELIFGKPIALNERLDQALAHLQPDCDKLVTLCRRALAGEAVRATEDLGDVKLLRKTYELDLSPLPSTRRGALSAGIVVRDLTSERLSERRFETLLEAAPDAMLIMRSDGIIEQANASAERMFRYAHGLNGIAVEDLLPQRFRRAHAAHRIRFFEHPATRPMGGAQAELWGLRADGSEFPVEISLNPLQVGSERMVVAAIRDMTVRQIMEDKLRQLSADLEERVADRTQALEKANRELSERIHVQQLAEDALAESMAEFRATFEQAAVGIAHVAPDGRWLRVNQQLCDIVGYRYDELLGLTFQELTHPDDLGADLHLMQRVLAGEISSYTLEKRYLQKGGNLVWINLTVSLARYSNGTPKYFIAVVKNIDAQKHAEDALRLSEARFRLAFDNIPDIVAIYDCDLRIQYVNPAIMYLTGRGPSDYIGRLAHDTNLPEAGFLWLPSLRAAMKTAAVQTVDVDFTGRNGMRSLMIACVPLLDASGSVQEFMSITHDYTERKQAEERVRQAGLHDPLTGLPNRTLLFEYADHLFARNQRTRREAGVLFVDLDRFKLINDTHGHEVGDIVLREVALRLTKNTRHGDFSFRFGGDEFLVLLPEIEDGADAAEVASHLAASLAKPYHVGALELSLSASIGISIYPRDGEAIDTLINHSDAAMYQAKQLGRNNSQFYSAELAERANAHTRIEQQLRSALIHGEFRLYYQPVVDMHSSAVMGVEALLRWPHAETGPDRFVPVAEATGLIDRLGEWVICEACRQHNAWCEHGLPAIPIAVNVSAVQFRHKDFAERFEKTMRDCHVDASALQVEVTETAMMEDLDHAIEVLIRLRSIGVKILLDDFGTGYSSLSYLSRLPIDKIKVDKSFIHRIENDMTSRAITGAIIAMGRTLNLEIVAEGIESESVLDYLRAHGCSQAQGFQVCAPIAADVFESWYRGRSGHLH